MAKKFEEGKTYTFEYLDRKIVPKIKLFCHNYIVEWNGSAAARKAGYTKHTAPSAAVMLLAKSYIQQYIEYIKEDFEKEAGLSKLKQLNELKKIAYSNIAKLHNTWITRKSFESLSDDDKAAIEVIESSVKPINVGTSYKPKIEKQEVFKIKLHPKLAAIETINKMMGYNATEKMGLTVEDKVDYSKVETDDLVKRAKLIKKIEGSKN